MEPYANHLVSINVKGHKPIFRRNINVILTSIAEKRLELVSKKYGEKIITNVVQIPSKLISEEMQPLS